MSFKGDFKLDPFLDLIYTPEPDPLSTIPPYESHSPSKSTTDEIKAQLHKYIKDSDLEGLKTYVDQLQTKLIHFDDPSLLLLAIEVYLDPTALLNANYQLDLIAFLIRCGISLWVPYGNTLLYILNWGFSHEFHTDAEFNTKLQQLSDHLLQNRQLQLIHSPPPPELQTQSPDLYTIINRHWAAYKIQRTYRQYRSQSL